MSREELIEKAAKAIAAFTAPEGWSAFRGEAEAALAVFEEAHAPTDDDWEVLRRAIASVLWNAGNYPDRVQAALLGQSVAPLVMLVHDAVLAAGFRRPVSPEPITEEQINAERARQIEKGYTPEHDRQHGIAHVLRYALHYGSRGEHLKAYAMVEAALEIAPPEAPRDLYAECACGHGRHTHVRYTGSCGLCDCPALLTAVTEQGENR